MVGVDPALLRALGHWAAASLAIAGGSSSAQRASAATFRRDERKIRGATETP
jgi:hypothetical protein